MGNFHDLAHDIERRLRKFNDGMRGTYMGVADTDYIDEHPLSAFALIFGMIYDKANNEVQREIAYLFDEISIYIGNNKLDFVRENDERVYKYLIGQNKKENIKIIIKYIDTFYYKVFGE